MAEYFALNGDMDKFISTTGNIERLGEGLDLTGYSNCEAGKDKMPDLQTEERKILASILDLALSNEDNDKLTKMVKDHASLLDRDISIRVGVCCPCLYEAEHAGSLKDVHFSHFSSWILNGSCFCLVKADIFRVKLFNFSVLCGNIPLTKLLLQYNCNVSVQLQTCRPLEQAAHNGDFEIMKLIIEEAKPQLSRLDYSCLLESIISWNTKDKFDMIQLLIDNEICTVNGLNITLDDDLPLATAVRLQDLDVTKYLLAKGANPNIDDDESPILFCALEKGPLAIVAALLDAGASPNVRCETLKTPLIFLINMLGHLHTSIAMMKLVLEKGGDPNLSVYGYSPLHAAVHDGLADHVKLLLEYGASTNIQSLDTDTPLHLAARLDHVECIQELLMYPIDVNSTDFNLNTPLHFLAFNGSIMGVDLLLDHGADPNACNIFGITPLWNAAYFGSEDLVRFLAVQDVTLEVTSQNLPPNQRYPLTIPYNCPRSVLWVALENVPTVVEFLLEIGYNVWQEKWLVNEDFQGLSDESVTLARQIHQTILPYPPTLKSICRRFIRRHCHRNFTAVIENCPLPALLKSYLLLKPDVLPCKQSIEQKPWICPDYPT